ncbi:MAG: hypothetical protein K9N34_02595 [Candidatus Marinimicrobia bacterium]|nr:hypothetical protein [Candidatus Neomarinimicrobiota bacterium]MCF7839657.1 hypothetical protein [Candidatus Neomarinimicrobiota bacterium]MCF7902056.1 hypothetical protein [Candidatus Neomarinimicrobiota bacterium]
MDIILLIIGIIGLLFGLALLLYPRSVVRLGEYVNRVLSTDETILAQRLIWGVVFIAAGIAILYKVFL